MKRYSILFFLSIAHLIVCDEPKAISPLQKELSKEEPLHDIMPPKEKFVEKIAKALLVHKKSPTSENNEKIYQILKQARKCHETMPTDADWLKLAASTHEQKDVNAQVALEAHRHLHGPFAFDHPYLSKWIWGIGGFMLGIVGTIAYACNSVQ